MSEAITGYCPCGKRVLRADLDGQLVTVDIWPVTASDELRAHTAGDTTYDLTWQHQRMWLAPRTPADIRLRPAGFKPDHRTLTVHRCQPGGAA